jgi:hypothetical protein
VPAQYERPIVTEEEAVIALPRIIPRTKPTPIPTPSIFDEPTYCLKVNKAWAGHFLGLILVLNNPDTWVADETHDVEWARLQVVEWVARFLTENDCMPCCDDLVEQLTELITINNNMLTVNTNMLTNITTIVTNLTTIINQGDTIINNDYTTQINQYSQQYNDWVTNNQTENTWNNMFYDGTPQSIAPTLGDNFNTTGGNDALCGAIHRYTENIISEYTANINLAAYAAGAIAGAIGALVIGATLGAAAPFIGAFGLILGAAVGVPLAEWNFIQADQEARRKVRCCMYDGLKDQAITADTFKSAVSDCGFDPTTNQGRIAGLIQNNATDANYLAFLRMLGQETGGSAADCVCDCDDDIALEDFAGTGCVITPMGNCIYRFVQPTLDPTYSVYYFSFRDIMSQCLHVERSADPSKPTAAVGYYTTVVDCHDVETSFPGGFEDVPDGHAPGLKSAHWFQGPDTGNVTYYKITLCADPDGC